MVFVAVDKSVTMQKFAELRPSTQMTDIGGYPTGEIGDDTSCLHSLDISDRGSLLINTLVSDGKNVPSNSRGSSLKWRCRTSRTPESRA